jgi:UDP-N-acetylmuramate dehydrogenase
MNAANMLAEFTTIGLGGPAKTLVRISTHEQLLSALRETKAAGSPFFVLGGGSNVVFSDKGFPGTVLKMELSGIAESQNGNSVLVTAGAGEPWDNFVAWTVARNYQGLECLSGIPGSVGATPIQNVGAYGQEVASTIVSVRVLDVHTLDEKEFTGDECGFSYRDSRFKSKDAGRYIVTAVTFRLTLNGAPDIRYAELKKEAETSGATTLSDVRDLVISIRKRKGMVVDPADPDSRSCGSFFTNPIINAYTLESVKARCSVLGIEPDTMPQYPYKDGEVKLSAAWLIERSGIRKGLTIDGAGISSKHSLALVNRGGTASALIAMKTHVQHTVFEKFGVTLVPEPILAGF